MKLPYQSAFAKYLPLAILIVIIMLSCRAFGADLPSNFPKFYNLGESDSKCAEATNIALYYISRLPYIANQQIYVVCNQTEWAKLRDKYHFGNAEAFSLLQKRLTFYPASTILAKGGKAVAHEIGHFKCDCPEEWRADAEASAMLKSVVPYSR